jgi:hypothetical protein
VRAVFSAETKYEPKQQEALSEITLDFSKRLKEGIEKLKKEQNKNA